MKVGLSFFVVLVLIAACSSVPQSLSPDVLYVRSMQLQVNGRDAVGTIVVPQASKYSITVKSQGNMDLLLIKSCHREWSGEKVSGRGWFQKTSSYVYEYLPDPDLEVHECPLQIASLDASKGADAWGYVDFEDSKYTLPVHVQCNGESLHYGGVSVCQARKGLVQQIVFDTDVIAKPGPGCELGNDPGSFVEGKEFVFSMPSGACYVTFMEKADARRAHRMTLIGYSDLVYQKQ